MYTEPQTLRSQVEELYRERIIDYLIEREEGHLKTYLENSLNITSTAIREFRKSVLYGRIGYFNLKTEDLEADLGRDLPPSHWINETFVHAVIGYAMEFPGAIDSLNEAFRTYGYTLVKDTETKGEKKMTTLSERLMNDLKEAMRNKETLRKGVITLIRAGLSKAEKEKKAPLTEVEETEVIQRELKQTRQTLAEGEKAGREDIIEASNERIAIIESYLPKMMTEEEIVSFLKDKGVQKGDNIGKIMGFLMKENKGKVDGSLAREVIQKHFA